MTPRRVLMTTDAVGGVWTYSLELARGLSEAGAEVMLAVVGPPPSDRQREEAIGVPRLVLVVPGLGLEWQDRTGPLALVPRQRLIGLARAFEPDIVHCNGFREAAAGFRVPVILVAHSCVRTWWWACNADELPVSWSAYSDGVRAGLSAASMVVTPSAAFLAEFCAAWGRVLRSRVIHNGLDLEPAPARARDVHVLAAGRLWDEAKGIGTLAAIAPQLPWAVRLAGESLADDSSRTVEWLGRLDRDRLIDAMCAASIFAAPACYEPFGLAILEAAACGCALVLGRIPSLVELWGDAARFVPPGDREALRRALAELIADPMALERAQAAARRRAEAFSRRRMVDEYLGLYAELLGSAHMCGHAA